MQGGPPNTYTLKRSANKQQNKPKSMAQCTCTRIADIHGLHAHSPRRPTASSAAAAHARAGCASTIKGAAPHTAHPPLHAATAMLPWVAAATHPRTSCRYPVNPPPSPLKVTPAKSYPQTHTQTAPLCAPPPRPRPSPMSRRPANCMRLHTKKAGGKPCRFRPRPSCSKGDSPLADASPPWLQPLPCLLLLLLTVWNIPLPPTMSGSQRHHKVSQVLPTALHASAAGVACTKRLLLCPAVHATHCCWLAAAPTGMRWLVSDRVFALVGPLHPAGPVASAPAVLTRDVALQQAAGSRQHTPRSCSVQGQLQPTCTQSHTRTAETGHGKTSWQAGKGHTPRSAECSLYRQQRLPVAHACTAPQYKLPLGRLGSWCWWWQQLKTD